MLLKRGLSAGLLLLVVILAVRIAVPVCAAFFAPFLGLPADHPALLIALTLLATLGSGAAAWPIIFPQHFGIGERIPPKELVRWQRATGAIHAGSGTRKNPLIVPRPQLTGEGKILSQRDLLRGITWDGAHNPLSLPPIVPSDHWLLGPIPVTFDADTPDAPGDPSVLGHLDFPYDAPFEGVPTTNARSLGPDFSDDAPSWSCEFNPGKDCSANKEPGNEPGNDTEFGSGCDTSPDEEAE